MIFPLLLSAALWLPLAGFYTQLIQLNPVFKQTNSFKPTELQAYAKETKYVDRSYPFFASQKSIKAGFNANSLAQTFALLYEGAGLKGASSHSGRRTFLTNLANKGTAIHILKTLAGHRSISTTAAYLYSSPSQLKAAVELV